MVSGNATDGADVCDAQRVFAHAGEAGVHAVERGQSVHLAAEGRARTSAAPGKVSERGPWPVIDGEILSLQVESPTVYMDRCAKLEEGCLRTGHVEREFHCPGPFVQSDFLSSQNPVVVID